MFIDKFFKKEVKVTNASENQTTIPSDAQVEIKEKEPEVKEEVKITEVSENQTVSDTPENAKLVVMPDKALPHEQKEQKEIENPPLGWREMKALKDSKYEDKIAFNPKFKKIYLIQNKRTKQIAEIRAASSYHACKIIGWRTNRVVLLGEKLAEEFKPEPKPETQSSSSNGTK